jgi:hypothetical protein
MTKDLNKTRLALLSAFAGVVILGCSNSGAVVEGGGASLGGSTSAVIATTVPAAAAPTSTIATDETASMTRERIAGDLQYIMPMAETAAATFADKLSGEYEITAEQAIGVEQTLWPWAVGLIGGWERSYEFSTDAPPPMRRAAVTTRVLLFESETDAVSFASRLTSELGSAVRWLERGSVSTADGATNAFMFRTQYRVTSDARSGKTGSGNVRGSVLVWTTYEDSEWKFNWGSTAEEANTVIFRELLAKYPDLAE